MVSVIKNFQKKRLWKTIQDGFSKQNLNQEVQEETKEQQDEKNTVNLEDGFYF